jgi:hypothetical protein
MVYDFTKQFRRYIRILRLVGLWFPEPGTKWFPYYIRFGAASFIIFSSLQGIFWSYQVYQTNAIALITIPITLLILGVKVVKFMTKNRSLQNIIESANDKQFQPVTWFEEAIIEQKQKRFTKICLTLIVMPIVTSIVLIMHPIISEVDTNIVWNVLLGDVDRCEHPFMFYGLWIYISVGVFLNNLANPLTELLQPFCMNFAVIQFELIAFRLQQLSVQDEDFEAKLIKHIKHHQALLKYCEKFSDFFSLTRFSI